MNEVNKDELLRRIAHLVKQNQDLEESLRSLERVNDRLARENISLNERLNSAEAGKKRVKEKGALSMKFNMATILSADIHGFPLVSGEMKSSEVMDELDEIIAAFDDITARYKIQKIRTIGDTFMCAGGIPVKNITNPVEVVLAAVTMRNFLWKFENERRKDRTRLWKLKSGIHTGPVAASVSGKKKVSYNLKGDTVHTASRIEAVSDDGMILISAMTYELVKEFFECEFLSRLPVRYNDDLPVYIVRSIKPALSVSGEGMIPNDTFAVKLGLIRFTDLQEAILDKLEKELPSYLHYHNVKHTVDVTTEVELIGWAEGCRDEEILLLKTAALFHDAGHIVSYDNHEFHSTNIARSILPEWAYSDEQIENICRLIMATKLPPKPADILESIICDSDLDYLGRSDFIPVSTTLFEELKAQKKMGSLNDWNKLQVKFISGHQYFTETARKLREVNKKLQIERIQGLITD